MYARFDEAKSATADVSRGYVPLFAGPFPDFTSDWYGVVGAQIIVVASLGAVTPALAPARTLVWVALRRRLRCCWPAGARRAVTQREFNRAWIAASGRFGLARRYGLLLTTSFGCLALSSGMPVLLGVASAILLFTYWADRYCLLRLSRRPPSFSGRLGRTALDSLEYALLLHLLIGIWMYSATGSDGKPMLPRPYTGQASTGLLAAASGPVAGMAVRVLNDLTLPLAALAVITAGYMIFRRLGNLACQSLATGFLMGSTNSAVAEEKQTYVQALGNGLREFAAGYDLTYMPPHNQVLLCDELERRILFQRYCFF